MTMSSVQFGEQINRLINEALAGGQTVTTIEAALNQAATNIAAIVTPPTHDRTIEDPGANLNPSQP
jgi:hypothetical protein